MDIRRLGPDDSSLLETAVRQVLLPSEPASAQQLVRAIADPRCYFLVSVQDDVPLGYLSAYRFPTVEGGRFMVYLYDLVVAPEHRRRGIGAQLVQELKEWCREDGVTRLWVGTTHENHAAQRTFAATGARRVSERYIVYAYDLEANSGAV